MRGRSAGLSRYADEEVERLGFVDVARRALRLVEQGGDAEVKPEGDRPVGCGGCGCIVAGLVVLAIPFHVGIAFGCVIAAVVTVVTSLGLVALGRLLITFFARAVAFRAATLAVDRVVALARRFLTLGALPVGAIAVGTVAFGAVAFGTLGPGAFAEVPEVRVAFDGRAEAARRERAIGRAGWTRTEVAAVAGTNVIIPVTRGPVVEP